MGELKKNGVTLLSILDVRQPAEKFTELNRLGYRTRHGNRLANKLG